MRVREDMLAVLAHALPALSSEATVDGFLTDSIRRVVPDTGDCTGDVWGLVSDESGSKTL